MKTGLIFDLDGTLVDSLQGIAASLNQALTASGLPTHPPAVVRGFIGNGARILIECATPPDASKDMLDTVEKAFKADYDSTWRVGTVVYDGITDLLETLQCRGYPLAVLSNKPHPFTEAMVSKMFPTIHFASVFGQRQGIPHKPHPAGAFEIASALQRHPENCAVIGDSTMDIETARNAGMRAIAVTWGFHDRARLAAAGADVMVDTPGELVTMFG